MKPYLVAIFSGIILIIAGLYSYFSNEARPFTAFIGPIFGLLFILSAPAIKNGNKTVSHIVVLFTVILAGMTGFMAYKSSNLEPGETRERRIQVFSAMAITCIGATAYYVNGFIERKKLEQNSTTD